MIYIEEDKAVFKYSVSARALISILLGCYIVGLICVVLYFSIGMQVQQCFILFIIFSIILSSIFFYISKAEIIVTSKELIKKTRFRKTYIYSKKDYNIYIDEKYKYRHYNHYKKIEKVSYLYMQHKDTLIKELIIQSDVERINQMTEFIKNYWE